MKKLLFLSAVLLAGITTFAQADKSKRPSPPAKVSETTSNGVTITVDYSQPSLKGRKVGTEVATYGQVWRTGANEATTFEVNKDVKVEGQALAAGKYSLYTIPGQDEWTVIFNKTASQWGTNYKEADDALRVKVKPGKAASAAEKFTINVSKAGVVSLVWGETAVDFNVK